MLPERTRHLGFGDVAAARCRVRSGEIAASRASIAVAMSATDPRYRSLTIFAMPSTQPISRR